MDRHRWLGLKVLVLIGGGRPPLLTETEKARGWYKGVM